MQSIDYDSIAELYDVYVIENDFVYKVFQVMNDANWHKFQLLTKRPKRMLEISKHLNWPENVWAGVSVESQKWTWRIECLREIQAKVRFLSCEPLLGALKLNLKDIHWVIVGGESGYGARTMQPEWVIDIQQQCSDYSVPFFFKQWGGVRKKKTGRILSGRTWDAMSLLK